MSGDATAAGGGAAVPMFDDVVHQRTRLGVLAILAEVDEADFTYLKSALGLTDGNLGQHIETLARHDLVSVRKGYEGKKPRTWVSITTAGRAGLEAEIRSLKALLRL